MAFEIAAARRREIERHGRQVGAADAEDFSRWLIAWAWHNSKSKDPLNAIIECSYRMGRKGLSTPEAEAILQDARATRRRCSADNIARFLGVTYAQRQALGLVTIGSIDVPKRARKELRKRKNRLSAEQRRRASGARPRAEYLANSISASKPWKAEGISRRTWERRRQANAVASPSAVIPTLTDSVASPSALLFLSVDDGLASKERKQAVAERER